MGWLPTRMVEWRAPVREPADRAADHLGKHQNGWAMTQRSGCRNRLQPALNCKPDELDAMTISGRGLSSRSQQGALHNLALGAL
jgi:hypothetical protein